MGQSKAPFQESDLYGPVFHSLPVIWPLIHKAEQRDFFLLNQQVYCFKTCLSMVLCLCFSATRLIALQPTSVSLVTGPPRYFYQNSQYFCCFFNIIATLTNNKIEQPSLWLDWLTANTFYWEMSLAPVDISKHLQWLTAQWQTFIQRPYLSLG